MYRRNTTLAFFFFNDTATTEIYTLSLHDALPISSSSLPSRDRLSPRGRRGQREPAAAQTGHRGVVISDRKSTRLNSNHLLISYAVFCFKKKKKCSTYKRR